MFITKVGLTWASDLDGAGYGCGKVGDTNILVFPPVFRVVGQEEALLLAVILHQWLGMERDIEIILDTLMRERKSFSFQYLIQCVHRPTCLL